MSNKTRALLLNMLAILCWAVSPVAIRYVKDFFPVNVQNFFRYLVSLFIIWPVFFISTPRSRAQNTFQALPSILPKLLIMACIVYVFQLSFTYSFFLLYPGFGSLVYKTGVIFSVLLAAMLFPDERRTLKSWKFQCGLLLAFIGVVLTITGGQDFGKVEFNLGVLLILIATASWSLLTALIKKWVPTVPASFSVSVILTIVSPLYLLTDIGINRGLHLPDAPIFMWLLMLASGIIGVGVAHSAYYFSVPTLGVALCATLDLSRPFLAGIISFLVFKESLTILQIVGGLFLLSGSYLAIKIRFRSAQ
jgi:drug/metabolite transporter (DMT)-like permease